MSGRSPRTVLTSEIGRVIDVFQVVRLTPDRLMLISESPSAGPAGREHRQIHDPGRTPVLEDVSPGTAPHRLSRAPSSRSCCQKSRGQTSHPSIPVESNTFRSSAMRQLSSRGNPVYSGWVRRCVARGRRRASVGKAAVNARAVPCWAPRAGTTPRIEAGIPGPEAELNDRVNPLEAGLEEFVSFTKGCYVGQEVIARLDTYDKVQRRLVHLDAPIGVAPRRIPEFGNPDGGLGDVGLPSAGERPIGRAWVCPAGVHRAWHGC